MNEDAQDKDSDQTTPPPETSSTGASRAPFVTLERVREVIGESDLDEWSSQKLLDAIGSGSKRTHQKHLETLRDERLKTMMLQFNAADTAPPMPKDLAETYWRQAWTMVNAKSATYMVQICGERDALKHQLASARSDVESYINSGEVADERLHQAMQQAAASAQLAATQSQQATAAKAALETLQLEMKDQQERSQAALEALQASNDAKSKAFELELANVRQHGEKQLKLEQKEAELLFRGLQEAVDRQAQREVDVRQQLADANRRADDNAKRVIELTDKLGMLVTDLKS